MFRLICNIQNPGPNYVWAFSITVTEYKDRTEAINAAMTKTKESTAKGFETQWSVLDMVNVDRKVA